MTPRLHPALVVAVLALAACTPAARATLETGDAGTLGFATAGTIERADGRFVLSPTSASLSGELTFPEGAGPFAAVVLMHGCGGRGNAERGWVKPLTRAGYATFVVDSFTGRGLSEVCTNSRALLSLQRIPDAYGALRVLATHPRLDARRIVLMGFSHGGGVTLASATQWAKDTYAAAGGATFRAFVPFYPPCTTDYPERHRMSAPLRIHIGGDDDWTPAAPCRELVQQLRVAGFDAEITVYPGAHHSFDNVGRSVVWLPRVDSAAACRLRTASILGPVLNPEELSCLHKGATLGWSAEATAQAHHNVLAQLHDLLR